MLARSPNSIRLSLLPDRRQLCGPVTRLRIARSCLVYLGIFSLGLVLAWSSGTPQGQAFGLGVIMPGGGFLVYADPLHGVLATTAFVLFVTALVVWFATGNVLAPPLVWLLAALAAASMEHGEIRQAALWTVPAAVAVAIGVAGLAAVVRGQRAARQRQEANKDLAEAASEFRAEDESATELSARDLQLMRFLLDRALQPIENFDGFEWRDQFQTAAVRYQLNFIGYALSMAQATRLPALGGYLEEAQRRLIDKQTDHRIWRYWTLENLWGNLAANADPAARDNIMFTGFCAAQIAMYHAASGRRDYERPGSFTLKHPGGRRYKYDLPALLAALQREQRRSAFHLVACEPNWIYPLCNSIGAAAMQAHDGMSGKQRVFDDASFRQSLENEFIDLAGRFVPCRSAYAGFALPMIGGAQPQAMPSFFLNATLPDVALRQWLLLRRKLVVRTPSGGALDRQQFWPIDTGNYRFSRAAAYAATAMTAAELGDAEVGRLCLAALDEECPAVVAEQVCYRPAASVWAHAVEFLARSGRQNGFRNLIGRPRDSAPRPVISEIRYPDVLVARAVSAHGMLAASLYPGQGSGRFPLGLSGLVPHVGYACDGTEQDSIVADRSGAATITVGLAGRTEIRIRQAV